MNKYICIYVRIIYVHVLLSANTVLVLCACSVGRYIGQTVYIDNNGGHGYRYHCNYVIPLNCLSCKIKLIRVQSA